MATSKGATTISEKGIAIIKEFEQLRIKAYRDAVGIPTIGYGTVRYPNGQPVKMGDQITRERAEELLRFEANAKSYAIAEALHGVKLTQNQFDALTSLAYNIGVGAFLSSTVLRRVKANPSDPKIKDAFAMWKYGTVKKVKVVLNGLVARRKKEYELYFS